MNNNNDYELNNFESIQISLASTGKDSRMVSRRSNKA